MKNVSIKQATLTDVNRIAPLFDAYRQFYKQPADLTGATRFLRERLENKQSIIFIAENPAQDTVGFCQIYLSFCSIIAAPIYILSDLFVTPDTRKCGVGKALLEKAYTHAQINNIARLDLTTAKTNTSAQQLYQSSGWTQDDVFYAYSKIVNQ